MILSEFQLLSSQQQADIIYLDGVFIGKRKVAEMTVSLYQVVAFYVEVYYRSYRKDISHFAYTLSPEILDQYALERDMINLTGYLMYK